MAISSDLFTRANINTFSAYQPYQQSLFNELSQTITVSRNELNPPSADTPVEYTYVSPRVDSSIHWLDSYDYNGNRTETKYRISPSESQYSSFSVKYVQNLEQERDNLRAIEANYKSVLTNFKKSIVAMKDLPEDFFGTPKAVLIYVELLASSALGNVGVK